MNMSKIAVALRLLAEACEEQATVDARAPQTEMDLPPVAVAAWA